MRIGIFADAHDHVDNIRRLVAEFNRLECELVLFAGDFVSPIIVPPLRKLRCRMIACFGDADGNKVGISGGMRIVGPVGEPPFCVQTADGTRILLTHTPDILPDLQEGCAVIVSAHTHRPRIATDRAGRLCVNPGEASGWVYRRPSAVLLETNPLGARVIELPAMPPVTVTGAK